MKKVAIAGATGAVGRQMLECIRERNLPVEVKLLASARSKGKVIDDLVVEELTPASFQDVDYVLGACENDVTKQWMPWAQEAGCVVVDNSSAFRLDDNVPLVVPEINPEDIENHNGIIANPNCSTIIALVGCDALKKEFGLKRMIVTTMQAVSGAGVKGIADLENQVKGEDVPFQAFPYQIAYNLIPQIGDFDEFGISKEEWKMQNEGRKIWHAPELLVNCTCVRVPVMRSHSESITLECETEVDVKKAREVLSQAAGVQLKDDPENKVYPMPLDTTDQDDVFIGRIRKDLTDPEGKTLQVFVCGDQIRKGAATNAVQILEKLLEKAE
ncbi:aspartate-semialdehyde dehydrogenase [uncultured Faecalibaculum sp.]|uniref:aspartate-semialdehyde dehydrogenase n=2 Tax=uncultured Faecalibaculum sp. TaxID=1729681 RepID=UPI0025F89880|nr:aspartate-semialdehyde dehydrogenase [uncultured Faecalibaculum sp.]